MRTPRFATLLAIITLGLIGCVTPDTAMESFLGHHSSELVSLWGPPHEKNDDGNGGQIWTYYDRGGQWTGPGQPPTSGYGLANRYGTIYNNPYTPPFNGSIVGASAFTIYTPPQTSGYRAHRTFSIDSSGKIYRHTWKGL